MRRLAAVLVLLTSMSAWADDCPKYGAIAWSPSAAKWGTSWNYSGEAVAEQSAVGWCGQADCRAVAWVRDQCLALAVTADGQAWGWGASTDLGRARAEALAQCMGQGPGCYVATDLCSPST